MAETAHSRDASRSQGKSAEAFRTISEVAKELDVPAHVLRFWETRFSQVKPLKRGGGRRYYRPEDVNLLRAIRELLYTEGYTIKGVQKLLREGGTKSVAQTAPPAPVEEPRPARTRSSLESGPAPVEVPMERTLNDRKISEIKKVLSELEILRDVLRRNL